MTNYRLTPCRAGRGRIGRTLALLTASAALSALALAGPASAGSGFVDGEGITLGTPKNTFVFDTFFDGGELTYEDIATGRTFNGQITCVNVVGNEATLVADDPMTGLRNRTFVQDNGSTGDKARNTLFNPNSMPPATRARNSACINPPSAQLDNTRPLPAGSRIRVQEYATSVNQRRAAAKTKSKKTKSKKTKKRSNKT